MYDEKYLTFQLKDLKQLIYENALDMMGPITGEEIVYNAMYNEGIRCLAGRLIYELKEKAAQE